MPEKQEGWLEERLELEPIRSVLADRKMPTELSGGIGWFYTLGSATLIAFIMLVVTGIMLMMNYSASTDHAYDSVQFIMNEVTYGWLIRGIHHWAASAMAILIFLHALRVFVFGAYKYPRELSWLVGVLLLLLVMGAAFTGYLLPWDQRAYWATVVGTEIVAGVPLIGRFLVEVVRGGESLGAVTLTRFYSVHVMIIPLLIASLVGIHLFMVVRQGISAPPKIKRRGDTADSRRGS